MGYSGSVTEVGTIWDTVGLLLRWAPYEIVALQYKITV